jgi:DNA-binding CsgD family transcriptional regulator
LRLGPNSLVSKCALLSDRQQEIFHLAARGVVDKQIAHELGIGIGTLRTYWQRLREKTGASNRAEVIAIVLREEYAELTKKAEVAYAIIESLPYGIWTLTSSGRHESWNHWFWEYGRLREPEISRSGYRALMLPQDHAASLVRWAKAVASGEPYREQVQLMRWLDQRAYMHEIVLSPLRTNDASILLWFGTCHAIEPLPELPVADETAVTLPSRSRLHLAQTAKAARFGGNR